MKIEAVITNDEGLIIARVIAPNFEQFYEKMGAAERGLEEQLN